MGFFDAFRRFRDEFQADMESSRIRNQIEAFKKSPETDEWVTLTIIGDKELERMMRKGWRDAVKIDDGLPDTELSRAFPMNEYLIRKRRGDLARDLGL